MYRVLFSFFCYFFFSSRRRHTRCGRDWSSDVALPISRRERFRGVADERVLSRYRRARAQPLLAMSVATDGLHRLFAMQAAPVAALRNLGMHAVDRLPAIKRFLIGGAAG